MPTAQPMMRPRLDFEPPLEEEEESLLEELEPAVGVGVTRTVFWIVTTPPPALVERLWTTELKGWSRRRRPLQLQNRSWERR